MLFLLILLCLCSPAWLISQNCGHDYLLKSQLVNNQSAEFHFSHLTLEINPNFQTDSLKAVATWTFLNTKQKNQIFFLLNPALEINQISENGVALLWNRNNDSIFIEINTDLNHSISIDYQGIPDSSGFGSYMKADHASGKIIWTLSEPFGAKDWFPCRQILSEKIDSLDIFVTTDSGFTAVSNGLLISQFQNNQQVTYHWKHKHRIAYYLVAFAVSNYIIFKNNENGIYWENYVFPHDTAHFQQSWASMPQIMEVFEQLTTPYPFRQEKYAHAQFPWQGGMEHQTISFMYNFTFELVAHELAHQWFGDYITCGSWQDLWLNEGFASYWSGLAWEKIQPDFMPIFLSYRLKRILEKNDGAVFCSDTSVLSNLFSGRLRYHKSCMVLHQLRGQMGDEAFFSAVKSYLNDPFLAFSTAKTIDFQRHIQKYASFSAENYFNDWIYNEGQPTFTFHQNFKSNSTLLKVEQTTSHPSVSLFKLRIPIRIYSESKLDSTDFWINFENNNQIFELKTHFKPSQMVFDPNLWIIADTAIYKAWDTPEGLIFPNPESGVCTLIESENIQEVLVFDASGKLISQYTPESSMYKFELPMAQGVYIVRWKTKEWKYAKTIVLK